MGEACASYTCDPREEGVKWAYISRKTYEDVNAKYPQGTKEFEENLPFMPFDEFVKEILV